MINGIYYNPTKIIFGKDTELLVGKEITKYSDKILLHYGSNSFKEYGLYNKVIKSLSDAKVKYIELGGVKSNPSADLVYKGIEICRKENINFILAVGGGSVIDSAKAISIGVPYQNDFINFFEGNDIPLNAIKVATILTIPGTGTESSIGSVIVHKEKGKVACNNTLLLPIFSILNPEITYTVPYKHTIYGIFDAITHILEVYFTNTNYVKCTDKICEGLIKTLMEYAVLVKDSPYNYDIRAEIMWACKLSNDGSCGFGRKQDWACHKISHLISTFYDIPHGAILSVIFPKWMEYVSKINVDKFIQFADRVFNIDITSISNEEIVKILLNKFKEFLKLIETPTTLRDIGILNKIHFNEISTKSVMNMKSGTIGNFVRLTPKDILNILEYSY